MAWHLIAAAAAAIAIRYRAGPPDAVTQRAIVASAADRLDMVPAPINPAWIISGQPVARAASHSQAKDGCAVTSVWDCTAGTFSWYFGWDETVVILDGDVHVTGEDGAQRLLRTGDIAYFPAGSTSVWRVDRYVRKTAFIRRPHPAPFVVAYRLRSLAGACLRAARQR